MNSSWDSRSSSLISTCHRERSGPRFLLVVLTGTFHRGTGAPVPSLKHREEDNHSLASCARRFQHQRCPPPTSPVGSAGSKITGLGRRGWKALEACCFEPGVSAWGARSPLDTKTMFPSLSGVGKSKAPILCKVIS